MGEILLRPGNRYPANRTRERNNAFNQGVFVSCLQNRAVCVIILLWSVQAVPHAGADRTRGLLWEISKAGIPSSYLFGTIHSEDPEVLQLAQPVEAAFDAAQHAVFEILLDRDSMVYSSTAMLMMDGRMLSELIGQSLFRQAARAIQSRGIPEIVLERMKPWAVAITLSMPVPGTGQVLDMALYEAAQQAEKPVYGLETIREQLDVFDTMPEADQLALLQDALENFSEIDAMHEELLAAYKQRDLAKLMAISDAAMETGDQQLAADFQRRLIVDRNRLMMERMQPYLGKGRAFVAIGALHLPGDQGLLSLLEQSGYTLRMLY